VNRRYRRHRFVTFRCKATGKVAFRDEDDADAALEARKDGARGETRAYPCDHCGGWHLTSQDWRRVEA